MEYRKYMHVERLGRDEVDGILEGKVYISPKIDGTNGVLYLDDEGKLCAGSRSRELSLANDNSGFYAHAKDDEPAIKQYLKKYPHRYVYGEWLIKNHIRWYEDTAWYHFYVFDVFDNDQQRYLRYEEYHDELVQLGANVIPTVSILEDPTMQQLEALLNDNHYLISDGTQQIGEGIVLKNYDFVNRFGRHCFAKIVAAEYLKNKSKPRPRVKMEGEAEQDALVFLTEEMIVKEFEKLKLLDPQSYSERRDKFNARLLQTIWHTFLSEEITNIDKRLKSPTIDLAKLKALVFEKVRASLPKCF